MDVTELIEGVTNALLSKIPPTISLDIDLWDAKTIGSYLKVGARQVLERYSLLPSFPMAIRLPSFSGGRSHPRWKAAEIVAWAEKFQEKKR